MKKKNEIKKKIVICAGGTGGHIYPALAVAEYIKDNYKFCEILFISSERGLGAELVPQHNISYRTVKSCGLVTDVNIFRKILNIIKFFYFYIIGFFQSLAIVLKFKPDIILGMGGYVCAPVLTAGIFTGTKTALHEQNYIPGRLNSFFSRFAKFNFISFNDTARYLKAGSDRVIFTGNPLRKTIKTIENSVPEYEKWGLEKGRFTITAFGGSLGAEKINNTVISLYDYFKNDNKIQILLISGKRFYDRLMENKSGIINPEDKIIFRIFDYISEINEIYHISDLLISRAGANTISEIMEYNIPSILVPYPQAVANHQFYNAEFLVKKGKAIMIEDRDLCEERIIKVIKRLAEADRKKYKEMKSIRINDVLTDSAGLIASKLMEN
jgi:UDP-N-acetylglucosamine--N-acetylmuramyl-(pentapeptide) pyrophosphoryl-undecaprenol N-acetylglucosamine transferase